MEWTIILPVFVLKTSFFLSLLCNDNAEKFLSVVLECP